MKKLALTVIGLVLGFAAPASAADLPVAYKAPMAIAYNWTGFYLGANIGYGTSRKCWDLIAGTAITTEGCHDATGLLAGGQFGYRWQTGNWVFGFEAQGDWAGLSTDSASAVITAPLHSNRSKINALGLFTGQVGYAINEVMIYAKGGGAVANDRFEGLTTGTSVVFDRANETRFGAVAGAGFEYAVLPNLSIGVEYDHLFLGRKDVTLNAIAGGFSRTDRIKQDVDIVTLRANYRFGGPVVAKY